MSLRPSQIEGLSFVSEDLSEAVGIELQFANTKWKKIFLTLGVSGMTEKGREIEENTNITVNF